MIEKALPYIIFIAIIVVMGFIIYLTTSMIKSLKIDNAAQKKTIDNYKTTLLEYGDLEIEKNNLDLQNMELKRKLNNIDIDKYADGVSDAPKRTRKNKSSDD